MLDKTHKFFVSSDTQNHCRTHFGNGSQKQFLNLLCIARIMYIHDATLILDTALLVTAHM